MNEPRKKLKILDAGLNFWERYYSNGFALVISEPLLIYFYSVWIIAKNKKGKRVGPSLRKRGAGLNFRVVYHSKRLSLTISNPELFSQWVAFEFPDMGKRFVYIRNIFCILEKVDQFNACKRALNTNQVKKASWLEVIWP